MATIEIPVTFTFPDTSGDVFYQPYSIYDTGTVMDTMVWTFNNGAGKIGLRGQFIVPQDYVGSPVFRSYWVSSATSGDAVFDLSYLTRTDAEDMGAAATDTTDTVTTTTDGTAFALNTSDMSLTAGDFAAGDLVVFELFRDSDNASDTLTTALALFTSTFRYSDT